MNKFLVIKAKTPELLERAKTNLRNNALNLLPFHPARIRVREFKQSLVLFANFEIPDTGGVDKHYVWTRHGTTFAYDGLPYTSDLEPTKNWAQQLNHLWSDDQRAIENVFGTWAFARFDEQDGGRFLSDFTGMTPLFYWKSGQYLAVSPRQMLLSGVCGSLEHDVESMAWLSGQANLIGDSSPWKNVRHLPPQWTMLFNAAPGDLTFQLHEREIWSSNIDPNPDDKQIQAICDSLAAQCEALSRLPIPPFGMDITGGLDSRLVAALVSASPLAEKVEHLQTSGPEGGHEIQVGQAIAALLGYPHVAKVGSPSRDTPQRILDTVRASVFRYEASLCPSDGVTPPMAKSRIVLTGSAGEIYRRHCKPHMNVHLRSSDELKTLYADYHQKTDPLGVEKPWVSESQRNTMQSLALDYHHAGADLNDISDIFFMRYRLPLWNGLMMNNIYGASRIYPLINYSTAKYAFSRGYLARIRDRIHFEVMLKVNPELCAAPFLKHVWPQEHYEYALKKGTVLATAPFPVSGKVSMAQRNSRMSIMLSEGQNLAKSYILDPQASALWDVIDRTRVEEAFRKGAAGFSITEGKQIFSLIGMQSALVGDDLRRPDGKAHVPPKLDGALAMQLFS